MDNIKNNNLKIINKKNLIVSAIVLTITFVLGLIFIFNINSDFVQWYLNRDKGNAIPLKCEIEVCTKDAFSFKNTAEEYIKIIKSEISCREPDFEAEIIIGEFGKFDTIGKLKDRLISTILCIPNGVIEMSAEIDGLVETSLNLGILKTEQNKIIMASALRSNKKTSLEFLEEKMIAYFEGMDCEIKTGGHYPPWEFNPDSQLIGLYKEQFQKVFGAVPKVEAVHAGLECGVFADVIDGFDCISVGPEMYDIHTTKERLSISSTEQLYKLLLEILAQCR